MNEGSIAATMFGHDVCMMLYKAYVEIGQHTLKYAQFANRMLD